MNNEQVDTAASCLRASYEGTIDFLGALLKLNKVGIESYTVDYRRGITTYYLPCGDHIEFQNLKTPGEVAAEFSAERVEANVRKSQAATHSYAAFCEAVKAAGCAGYIVSILGRRVVYFGRTGEIHVEIFPS